MMNRDVELAVTETVNATNSCVMRSYGGMDHFPPYKKCVVDRNGLFVGFLCSNCFSGGVLSGSIDAECSREFVVIVSSDGTNRYRYPSGPFQIVSTTCDVCGETLPWFGHGGDRFEPEKLMSLYSGPICPACKRSEMSARSSAAAAEVVARRVARRMKKDMEAIACQFRMVLDRGDAVVVPQDAAIVQEKEARMSTQSDGMFGKAAAAAVGFGIDRMALRSACTQATRLVREPVIAAIKARTKSKREAATTVNMIVALAETTVGDGAVRLFLAGVVKLMPGFPDGARAVVVDEFMVSGGAKVLDAVAEVFTVPLTNALSGVLTVLADPAVTARMVSSAGGVTAEAIEVKPRQEEPART